MIPSRFKMEEEAAVKNKFEKKVQVETVSVVSRFNAVEPQQENRYKKINLNLGNKNLFGW